MTAVTGSGIGYMRMYTLSSMLGLEIKGMKRRGRSAYSIIKEEYGLKGNKQKVLDQFCDLIDKVKAGEIQVDEYGRIQEAA